VIASAVWSASPTPLLEFAYRVFDMYRRECPSQMQETWTAFFQTVLVLDVKLPIQVAWPSQEALEQLLQLRSKYLHCMAQDVHELVKQLVGEHKADTLAEATKGFAARLGFVDKLLMICGPEVGAAESRQSSETSWCDFYCMMATQATAVMEKHVMPRTEHEWTRRVAWHETAARAQKIGVLRTTLEKLGASEKAPDSWSLQGRNVIHVGGESHQHREKSREQARVGI
jgi:hypothetical protein